MSICSRVKETVSKVKPEPVRIGPNEPGNIWYPLADLSQPSLKTQGKYKYGYPEGAIVHFTAGGSALSSLNYGRKQKYCFFMIDFDGTVYQSFPLNRWGYHGGPSKCPVTRRTSVSKYYVGIEVACAGKLTKLADGLYKPWFDAEYSEDQVRFAEWAHEPGYYHKYTKEQEKALTDLLIWLKNNNPDKFSLDLVFGHDEVAPTRKNDPGGSLSMSMKSYRALLNERFKILWQQKKSL